MEKRDGVYKSSLSSWSWMEHINGKATVVEEKWLKDIFNIANQEKWKMDAHTISTLRNEIHFFCFHLRIVSEELKMQLKVERDECRNMEFSPWQHNHYSRGAYTWQLSSNSNPIESKLFQCTTNRAYYGEAAAIFRWFSHQKKRYIHGTYIRIFFFHNFFSRRTEAVSCFFNILLSIITVD